MRKGASVSWNPVVERLPGYMESEVVGSIDIIFTPEHYVQALRAGFQMHIAKPVEPAELVVVVANLAGRMRGLESDKDA